MTTLTVEMAERTRARFLEKFTPGPADDCWEWEAARTSGGYGKVFLAKRQGRTVLLGATRVAWVLAHQAPLAGDVVIRHTCDNPPCVNPGHLLAGTHLDNHNDSIERGRSNRGVRHGNSRFTLHQVRDMRRRYAEGQSIADIGRWYGDPDRHHRAIHSIIHGYTWGWDMEAYRDLA